MQDPNSLINPGLGFQLEGAVDINEDGQILALADLNGHIHTYLLNPSGRP